MNNFCFLSTFSYHFSKRAKSGDKGGLKETPDIGHVCCARYTVDNVWYRALVTAVSDKDGHVTVLYIDEGNNESLPLSRLRELDEKFASLSRQTLRVQLRDVELSEDTELSEGKDNIRILYINPTIISSLRLVLPL